MSFDQLKQVKVTRLLAVMDSTSDWEKISDDTYQLCVPLLPMQLLITVGNNGWYEVRCFASEKFAPVNSLVSALLGKRMNEELNCFLLFSVGSVIEFIKALEALYKEVKPYKHVSTNGRKSVDKVQNN